jgi:chloride channel protein, CIC family
METHPLPPARSLWRWFPEFLELGRTRYRSQIRLMGSSVLVGIVTGLAAVVFFMAFQFVVHFTLNGMVGYHPHPPRGEPELLWLPQFNTPLRPWLFLIVPTVGGLLSGVIVFTLAPEAEGHGTDSVIAAYHYHQGQMRSRVPLVKIIATAITIGTGGSGGQEGPITQIGGGSGSVVANLLRLRPAERRILLAAGMGAGIAAIFRAPLAGALFAAEVLYSSSEFEPEVIIPAGIASVLAYCTFGLCTNAWKPLVFSRELLPFDDPWQLGPYLILALCMVLLAMLYTRSFYSCQRLFHHLPIQPHFKPAIGAGLNDRTGEAGEVEQPGRRGRRAVAA